MKLGENSGGSKYKAREKEIKKERKRGKEERKNT